MKLSRISKKGSTKVTYSKDWDFFAHILTLQTIANWPCFSLIAEGLTVCLVIDGAMSIGDEFAVCLSGWFF